MVKSLWENESGITVVEILVSTIAMVLLIIIAFAGLRGGIWDAATQLGSKIKNSTSGTGAGW